jgi:hypothetical protein
LFVRTNIEERYQYQQQPPIIVIEHIKERYQPPTIVMHLSLLFLCVLATAQKTHTYPPKYQCDREFQQNGKQYTETIVFDFEGAGATVQVKPNSRLVSFNHNKTTYSITSSCEPGTLYSPVTPLPAMPAAYKYLGEAKIDGQMTDRFGEIDQYANHSVYFKKGSWEPVAVYDASQEKSGIGLTHYSKCIATESSSLFELPSMCFK